MKNNIKLACLFFGLIIGLHNPIVAQEDWKTIVNIDSIASCNMYVSTFKTTRLINAQSVETAKNHSLDFRISHRFGNVSMGDHGLWGLDGASDIRFAFEYGVSSRLTVGVSRSRIAENLEGLIKYRLFQQREDGKMPISITLFANTAVTPQKDFTKTSEYAGDYAVFAHRMSYTYQMLIARKFSRNFSFQLMPSLVHRNFISDPNDKNDLISIGVGGRLKFSKRSALVVDYFYNIRPNSLQSFSYNANMPYYNPLGIGWEIETGGHVFTIMFTNAAGLIENEFLPYTTDSWLKKGFKFSFDISRSFSL